jgi:hypothetical protein
MLASPAPDFFGEFRSPALRRFVDDAPAFIMLAAAVR